MIYFDLVFDEAKKINIALNDLIETDQIWFVSASLEKIVYATNEAEIIFNYNPNRYEFGKYMSLKGLIYRFNHEKERQYSIADVISFIESGFNDYQSDYSVYSVEQILDKLKIFLSLIKEDKNMNWEQLFIANFKNKYHDIPM